MKLLLQEKQSSVFFFPTLPLIHSSPDVRIPSLALVNSHRLCSPFAHVVDQLAWCRLLSRDIMVISHTKILRCFPTQIVVIIFIAFFIVIFIVIANVINLRMTLISESDRNQFWFVFHLPDSFLPLSCPPVWLSQLTSLKVKTVISSCHRSHWWL